MQESMTKEQFVSMFNPRVTPDVERIFNYTPSKTNEFLLAKGKAPIRMSMREILAPQMPEQFVELGLAREAAAHRMFSSCREQLDRYFAWASKIRINPELTSMEF